MADNRKLHHLKGFRVQTGDGPPRPNEGVDGDITIRTTRSGLRLFIKFRNKWYTFGGNGNLGIPGGSNTEQVLSTPDLRPVDSATKGRGLETFINTKSKNLEMGGNLKLNKGGFINRDGVSDKGLYFGRDDVNKPGQAYFDDDVFIQLGYKLILSDGDLAAEGDGNGSWIVGALDTVVQHVVDGVTFLELDMTNTRLRVHRKALIGQNGHMTIDDNEIDVSSGDLTLDVAGDLIVEAADVTIENTLTMGSGNKLQFVDAFEFISGDGNDLSIQAGSRDVKITAVRHLNINLGNSLFIDVDGGAARLTDDSETDNVFTPAHDADITTKKYVDDNDAIITQIFNFGFNYSYTAGTKIYVPLNGYIFENSSLTGRNEYSQIIAPYDGYLDRVVMRGENLAGSSIVGLHKAVDGTELPSATASNTVTVDMAAGNTSYNFAFGSGASFSAGDILAISFDPYRDPNDSNGTAVFKFDKTTSI